MGERVARLARPDQLHPLGVEPARAPWERMDDDVVEDDAEDRAAFGRVEAVPFGRRGRPPEALEESVNP